MRYVKSLNQIFCIIFSKLRYADQFVVWNYIISYGNLQFYVAKSFDTAINILTYQLHLSVYQKLIINMIYYRLYNLKRILMWLSFAAIFLWEAYVFLNHVKWLSCQANYRVIHIFCMMIEKQFVISLALDQSIN